MGNILKEWEKLSNNELEELIKCLTDPDYDNEEENKELLKFIDSQLDNILKTNSINTLSYKNNN